jgi:DNA-binding transcriptional ArsR family regulator
MAYQFQSDAVILAGQAMTPDPGQSGVPVSIPDRAKSDTTSANGRSIDTVLLFRYPSKYIMSDSDVFKALADANRREILRILRRGPLAAGDLADKFELSKATLSHHLKLLKEADLVRCESRAQQRVYSLNTTVFEDVAALLMDILGPEPKRGKSWKRSSNTG